MKSKHANECGGNGGGRLGLGFCRACVRMCRKILAQIRKTRDDIFGEWRGALKAHERMLQLALNEAEALAWQTPHPHLFFPDLAMEKVRALAAWEVRQRRIAAGPRGLARDA